ncbi:Lipase (class 3) [Luteibacter sp. UNC138MFCol5.1]|uniref:XVIPCD domain-containing protein n=1 Tax=Luteibacter sp. UNC138MFCol5.1 TaxID=1502774 RepID=UPI0008BC9FC3|nr:XVIPCD domain-containing protein [Luteibacter sp. UNC138MFCol5.1]SEO82550.1 Lipase (class 3) [Luteibacter sp. UNC138MFCol5.1]
MNLSSNDYAYLASDSYKERGVEDQIKANGNAFEVFAVSRPSHTGFQGTAYRTSDHSTVVIAFRGTEFDREPMRDGGVDAAMVLAGINPQRDASERFARKVIDDVRAADRLQGRETQITVTGHSLGGTLAQLNAAKFGLDGHTFNAYGAQNLDPDLHESRGRIVNHCRAGDPVCAAADHIGTVKVYATQSDIDRLKLSGYTGHERQSHLTTVRSVDFAAHGIDNFVDGNAINGASILGPESQARYRANQSLVDMYRSDIHFIRERASLSWEVPDAIGREVQRTVMRAAGHVEHGAEAFGLGVASGAGHVFAEAGRFGHALGDGAQTAADHTYDYLAGRASALGNDLRDVGNGIGERLSDATHVAAHASPLTSPLLTDRGDLYDTLRRNARLDEPAHPAYGMFRTALFDVEKLDAQVGRQPDQLSANLAAALTAAAREQGMSHIDSVKLSKDASWAFAVQGSDSDPHKKVATVATELGIATTVSQSTAAWQRADDRDMQARAATSALAQMPNEPTQGHAGPSFSR